MVVCVMEPALCCGSGVRVTTSAGRLLPGVSYIYLLLHLIANFFIQIAFTSKFDIVSSLQVLETVSYRNVGKGCVHKTQSGQILPRTLRKQELYALGGKKR
jgi:hypothetical protein